MNKRSLSINVAKQTGLSISAASKVIDVVFQTIGKSIESDEHTTIHGFGSFSSVHRAERKGVNPVTKQSIVIPERKVVRFTASKKIKLNESK